MQGSWRALTTHGRAGREPWSCLGAKPWLSGTCAPLTRATGCNLTLSHGSKRVMRPEQGHPLSTLGRTQCCLWHQGSHGSLWGMKGLSEVEGQCSLIDKNCHFPQALDGLGIPSSLLNFHTHIWDEGLSMCEWSLLRICLCSDRVHIRVQQFAKKISFLSRKD